MATPKLKYEDDRETVNTLGNGGSKWTKQKLLTLMQTAPLISLLLTGKDSPTSPGPHHLEAARPNYEQGH